MSNDANDQPPESGRGRRGFLKSATTTAMASGLVAGYGTFGIYAGRFLFPTGNRAPVWQFVATIDQLNVGDSLAYTAPSGAKVVIARQSGGESAEDFIALSSVCPHLGCQVHWESVKERFFCPCHNGAFDATGAPTEGPPAKAKQYLTRFPLKVEGRLLYIDAPTTSVVDSEARV